MKRFISISLAVVLIAALSACGSSLSGTYYSENGASLKFSGKEVAVSAGFISFSGNYEIKDDKIIISYTYDGEKTEESFSFEKIDSKTIKFDSAEFKKE